MGEGRTEGRCAGQRQPCPVSCRSNYTPATLQSHVGREDGSPGHALQHSLSAWASRLGEAALSQAGGVRRAAERAVTTSRSTTRRKQLRFSAGRKLSSRIWYLVDSFHGVKLSCSWWASRISTVMLGSHRLPVPQGHRRGRE